MVVVAASPAKDGTATTTMVREDRESPSSVDLNVSDQAQTKSTSGFATTPRTEPGTPQTPTLVPSSKADSHWTKQGRGREAYDDATMDSGGALGLQYSQLSSPAGFLASPEVITLRASVNDKDIELLDLRRQLQKLLVESKATKVSPATLGLPFDRFF